jgi:hypothetical protein
VLAARRLLPTLAVLVALAVAAAPALAQGGGGVIVVGDSLEVGTSPYLGRYLPGVPLTVDAVESRPSGDAVQALRDGLRASHSVIVFDAGVNDDPAQRSWSTGAPQPSPTLA